VAARALIDCLLVFVARMLRQHIDTLQAQRADLKRHPFHALKPYEAALQSLLTIPGIDRRRPAPRGDRQRHGRLQHCGQALQVGRPVSGQPRVCQKTQARQNPSGQSLRPRSIG
jgi:hypothetical protein